MMKYRVLKAFIDKKTFIGYNEGNTYESSDSERVAFLIEKGFLVDEKPSVEELDYIELKQMAKDLGIEGYNKMKKEALLEAVQRHGPTTSEN
ncbi:Rho termination factor N-terminal domain-containing protein [Kurthia populi]|uniref:Rho termination factor N-terminal domain-containing protein n=2 Tax=Kurthia populi TaxID=1562132 RepID=A0ABW5Y4W6_9BACL